VKTLTAILRGVDVLRVSGAGDTGVTGVAYDSRRVESGTLFVALKGENVDSHSFISEVLDAGASVVVGTDAKALAACPVSVLVNDAREALAAISNNFFDRPGTGLVLVGVTGTNGKTTFTYLLEAALVAAGKSVGVVGTIEARFAGERIRLPHTTPESTTLCELLSRMQKSGVEMALLEVSSHGLALKRVHGLDFSIGVFTNLSQDHLDFHRDLEEYGSVKESFFTELLAGSEMCSAAVINRDDPWGVRIASGTSCPQLTYGLGEAAGEIRAVDVKQSLEGLSFTACGPWGEVEITSPLVGRHNVYNLLAVLGTVHVAGCEVKAAAKGIAGLGIVPGRLEAVANPFGLGIWVDYCHTPDALEKVLVALREIVPGRLITVFGAGGDRDRKKRPEMGAVVEKLSDVAVVTSDNPRTEDPMGIIGEILDGMSAEYKFNHTLVCADRRKAIEAALGFARSGDGILVGGKGHEDYQLVMGQVHHFDDCEVARECIAALEGLRK